MTRVGSLLAALTLSSVTWFTARAAFGITQDEAVSVAREFAPRVGWDTEEAFEAVFPGWPTRPNVWRVSAGEIEVLVEDVSGRIVKASNGAIIARVEGQAEAVAAIPQDQAEQAAYRYLETLGIPPGADLARVSLERLAVLDPSSALWKIVWHRVHNGFRFLVDDAVVLLRPADGCLFLVALNWVSPLPQSTRVLVTEDQAIAQARAYLAGLGFQAGAKAKLSRREGEAGDGSGGKAAGHLTSTRTEIVQPNDYWEWYDLGTPVSVSNYSRLAWLVEFDAPWDRTEVWVDSESGLVLGGVHCRSIPKSRLKLARPAIAAAGDIVLTAPGILAEPVHVCPESEEGQRLLAAIPDLPRAEDAPSDLPVTLLVQGKDRSYLLGYSAADHRLVLLEKTYQSRAFRAKVAWQTTEELDSLLARHLR